MMYLALFGLVAAHAFELDCNDAACRSACDCSSDKCHVLIDECLGDPECSKAQDCAMKCSCGDTDCLSSCAAESGSVKSLEVSRCIVNNCHAADRSLQPQDCNEHSCPSLCECTVDHCVMPGLNCQFSAKCRAFAECASQCGCEDAEGCGTVCAEEHDSPQTQKMYDCIKGNCIAEQTREVDTPVPDDYQLPGCDTVACPSVCECTLLHCGALAVTCQFNAECRAYSECASKCGCEDTGCAEVCAAEHDSTATLNLLECVADHCDIKQRDVHALSESAEQTQVDTRDMQLPDCAEAACPAICECTLLQCALPALNCQFNAACRAFAECSLTCGCGDTPCATACAEDHDSTQTVKMLECMIEKCDARV